MPAPRVDRRLQESCFDPVLIDLVFVTISEDRIGAGSTSWHINPDCVYYEDVSFLKYLEASFTATGQAVDTTSAHIDLACATFNRLRTSLWSGHES